MTTSLPYNKYSMMIIYVPITFQLLNRQCILIQHFLIHQTFTMKTGKISQYVRVNKLNVLPLIASKMGCLGSGGCGLSLTLR